MHTMIGHPRDLDLSQIAPLLFGAPPLRNSTRIRSGPRAVLRALCALHSGHIGDYIAWWTAAAALLGGASLILLT